MGSHINSLSGGFLRSAVLPSPPASSVAASSVGLSTLPTPRRSPLKFGSSKETAFINYVDQSISTIQKRLASRTNVSGPAPDDSGVQGYRDFKEASQDVDHLIDVVWISGTPSLQISYFLSLALTALSLMQSLPPYPKSMFRLLGKLDVAFASLIEGQDLDSGESLPGFEGGRTVNATEKVRIKSLVERTRVVVVEVMNAGDFAIRGDSEHEEARVDHSDSEIADAGNDDDDDDDTDRVGDFDMEIARVYDRTLVELGDTLEGPSIGITNE